MNVVGLRQRWYTNEDLDSGETRPVHPFSIDIAKLEIDARAPLRLGATGTTSAFRVQRVPCASER